MEYEVPWLANHDNETSDYGSVSFDDPVYNSEANDYGEEKKINW